MTSKFVKIVLASILLLFMLNCEDGEKKNKPEEKEVKGKNEKFIPPELTDNVLGSWIRPDGGYNLQILEFRESNLDAAYFNPNPINVSETQWKIQDGFVYLYVKFDDVNYRGSYYSLGYLPDRDILAGFYYQAAMNQKFDIYFEREKQ
jgi:hypothetical protein